MTVRMVDLCCGVGGMSLAFSRVGCDCVFASEIDEAACDTFEANHGFRPAGDLAGIDPRDVPDHEVCLAGLPCVGFSTAGLRGGFDDPREHVLHGILRILAAKRPDAVVIENVVGLVQHERGRSFRFLRRCLRGLGYEVSWRVLRAADFGGAQPRPRVLAIGSRGPAFDFDRLRTRPPGRLRDILEPDVREGWLCPHEYTLFGQPVPWGRGLLLAGHRNQAMQSSGDNRRGSRTREHGHRIFSAEGLSPTLLAHGPRSRCWVETGGRVRQLTLWEQARLMGFPDSFQWVHPGQTRSQLGNSVYIPLVQEIARAIREQLFSEVTG